MPTAKDLLGRYLTGVGGGEACRQAGTLVYRGKGRESDREFEAEIVLKPPGLVLLSLRSANGSQFEHGRSAADEVWSRTPDGVRVVSDAERQRDLFDLGLALGAYGPERLAELYGAGRSVAVTREGKPAFAIWIGQDLEPRLVLDAATGFLIQVGDVQVSDYRSVQGLRLPHAVRVGANVAFTFEAVELGAAVADARFDAPKTPAAAAPGRIETAREFATQLSRPDRLEIVRRPPPVDYQRGSLKVMARWDPESSAHAQVDLRGYDLRELAAEARLTDLLHADFDSRTRFPAVLPEGFDPQRVMVLGRDPGLGVRSLHAAGLKGKGIGIGIIDQTLLVDHVEYGERLRLYEEIHYPKGAVAAMHGAAVASIAVGKTVGVAPEADLYYIAQWHMLPKAGGGQEWDFTSLAESILRLLEINRTLPAEHRIRVISISVGWSASQAGFEAANAAVEWAGREGVFVVSTCLEQIYGLCFHGLGREALADPNQAGSYGPGSWWKRGFREGGYHQFAPGQRLLVPMDARTTASPTGNEDYVHYDSAGWSWSVPWIAGLYVLACEVRPDLTPAGFWSEALATGRTVQLPLGGKDVEFGTIADPVALIEHLRR